MSVDSGSRLLPPTWVDGDASVQPLPLVWRSRHAAVPQAGRPFGHEPLPSGGRRPSALHGRALFCSPGQTHLLQCRRGIIPSCLRATRPTARLTPGDELCLSENTPLRPTPPPTTSHQSPPLPRPEPPLSLGDSHLHFAIQQGVRSEDSEGGAFAAVIQRRVPDTAQAVAKCSRPSACLWAGE